MLVQSLRRIRAIQTMPDFFTHMRSVSRQLSLLALFCLLSALPAAAQERQAAESDLKAAFIFNFVRFTEFPATATPDVLKICYAAHEPMAGSLKELSGKRVGSRQIRVVPCFSTEEASSADIVVISQSDQRYARALLGAVRGRPVLTIGDFKGFRKMGGTLNLVVESDRMRFKVNLQAVRQQKLRIHPQLLKLASEIEE